MKNIVSVLKINISDDYSMLGKEAVVEDVLTYSSESDVKVNKYYSLFGRAHFRIIIILLLL